VACWHCRLYRALPWCPTGRCQVVAMSATDCHNVVPQSCCHRFGTPAPTDTEAFPRMSGSRLPTVLADFVRSTSPLEEATLVAGLLPSDFNFIVAL